MTPEREAEIRADDERDHANGQILKRRPRSAIVQRRELLGYVDELRAQVVRPRCGASAASVFDHAASIGPCILEHGHGGMHEAAGPAGPPFTRGAQWIENNDALARAYAEADRLRDAFELAWAERNEARDLVRVLARHVGVVTATALCASHLGMDPLPEWASSNKGEEA